MFCTVLLLAGGALLWYKALTIPTHDAPRGPVCVCPQDDGKPASREIIEERYY